MLQSEMDGDKFLVLINTNKVCEDITRKLRQNGWPALSFHADTSLEEKEKVFEVILHSPFFFGLPSPDLQDCSQVIQITGTCMTH